MSPLRLPKRVDAELGERDLASELAARAEPLWAGAELRAIRVDVIPALEEVLKQSFSAGQVVRGLELAERTLGAEARGLSHVDKKTGIPRGERVSRLLVLTDDGAERFYRRVESLLREHGPRVLALRLSCDERTLGGLLFGPDQVARLLLVEHKDAVAALLLALANTWRGPGAPKED